jgi:GT2 family glycosyltransferase
LQFDPKTLRFGAILMNIAILLTCHNRRNKTSKCLRSLRSQVGLPAEEFGLSVFLVDDGCTDGTADAALKIWPEATIVTGDGSLFWCGGMRKAWEAAAVTNPDYYLLVNDDTVLFPKAIISLMAICPTPESRSIAVGATRDPDTGEWTYGGLEANTSFVENAELPRRCRTMNANCVLVPRAVFAEIGMFSSVYRHAMGDMDYGFAASNRGIPVLEASAFVGECKCNSLAGTWRDKSLPRRKRFTILLSPKGLPPKEWLHYCWRNHGIWWPRYAVTPYLRVLLGA